MTRRALQPARDLPVPDSEHRVKDPATSRSSLVEIVADNALHPREAATLMRAEDHSPTDHKGRGPSQRDKLIAVGDRATFWRSPEGIAHASVPVDGHVEHHKVRSNDFKDWLLYEAGSAFPDIVSGRTRPGSFGKNAIEDALAAFEASARATRVVKPAPLRIAALNDVIYLDLGRPDWEAVEISRSEWRIVPTPPVPILRTSRTRPLPVPERGGSIERLRALLPVGNDDEFRLVIVWLLSALRPTGPYPILALSGEEGTGKSQMARRLRGLVDPSGSNIMQPPHKDGDLIAAAKTNHVLAFDNLSTMKDDLADGLCRLATGGDIGGRMLYTNDDSAVFAAQRPMIINGIPDLAARGDLASRALVIRLEPIRERRTEGDLSRAFDAAAPGILGALLDALSGCLRYLPEVTLPADSAAFRMADVALLAMAAEKALGWPEGSALSAIRRNRRDATAVVVDLDPVAMAIRGLVAGDGQFSGRVSALYDALNIQVDYEIRRGPGWPKDNARLGSHLRRIAPALRSNGIVIEERRRQDGVWVDIRRGVPSAPPSAIGAESDASVNPSPNGSNANSMSHLPTSPTPRPLDGAFQPTVGMQAGVGDLGGVEATSTAERAGAIDVSAADVGGAGEEGTEFASFDELPAGAAIEL